MRDMAISVNVASRVKTSNSDKFLLVRQIIKWAGDWTRNLDVASGRSDVVQPPPPLEAYMRAFVKADPLGYSLFRIIFSLLFLVIKRYYISTDNTKSNIT